MHSIRSAPISSQPAAFSEFAWRPLLITANGRVYIPIDAPICGASRRTTRLPLLPARPLLPGLAPPERPDGAGVRSPLPGVKAPFQATKPACAGSESYTLTGPQSLPGAYFLSVCLEAACARIRASPKTVSLY